MTRPVSPTDTLRPAQARALAYTGGRMAISAAPGAGKTYILTRLVVRLVADLGVRPGRILVLTYMRSAALTFRARVAAELAKRHLPATGLLACTIHSFCQRVLRHEADRSAGLDEPGEFRVISEAEQLTILRRGLDQYLRAPEAAQALQRRSPDRDPEESRREITEAARRVISAGKQARRPLPDLLAALDEAPEIAYLTRLYHERQQAERLLDFDDLLVSAVDRLESDPGLLAHYRSTFEYLLEDEAQDSTPIQNRLLELLAGPDGNLVRVGDPNQAIMSSFTNSAPTLFRDFCARTPTIAMTESSRSAAPILELANRLVAFSRLHPDPVISGAFSGEPIQPASAGPRNPDAAASGLSWSVYESREHEIAGVVADVRKHLEVHPNRTCAILCATNAMIRTADGGGYLAALQAAGLPVFDDSPPATRASSLALLRRALTLLNVGPPDARESSASALVALAHALAGSRGLRLASRSGLDGAARRLGMRALVATSGRLRPARPADVAESDYLLLVEAAEITERLLGLRGLPPTDLLLSAALLLEPDNPDALLLAARIGRLVETGPGRPRSAGGALRAALNLIEDLERTGKAEKLLAEPAAARAPGPGQVVVTTLHRSKGAEYDAVWIPNLGYTYGKSAFPWTLDEVRIFDEAGILAERLARGESGGDAGLLAFRQESAAERLRLLYVGITRARLYLALSCSSYGRGPVAPAHVLALAEACRAGTGPGEGWPGPDRLSEPLLADADARPAEAHQVEAPQAGTPLAEARPAGARQAEPPQAEARP